MLCSVVVGSERIESSGSLVECERLCTFLSCLIVGVLVRCSDSMFLKCVSTVVKMGELGVIHDPSTIGEFHCKRGASRFVV